MQEIVCQSDAMLKFETVVDGVLVNGVDLIKWNGAGQFVECKVTGVASGLCQSRITAGVSFNITLLPPATSRAARFTRSASSVVKSSQPSLKAR